MQFSETIALPLRRKKLNHGYAVWQQNLPIEKLPEYSNVFLQFFIGCCIASTTVKIMRKWWNFKVQMKCFFLFPNLKGSKNQEDRCLPFLNISSSSRVITV